MTSQEDMKNEKGHDAFVELAFDWDLDALVVEPLAVGDIWKASKTWYDAFLDDPMMNYINCEEPPSRVNELGQRTVTSTALALWRQTKVVLTVSRGEAVVISTPPDVSRDPLSRHLDKVFDGFLSLLSKSGTPERKKRRDETRNKMDAAIQKVIGDAAKEMWYINLLCSSPSSQGHGFGSALLQALKARLDHSGKTAWLTSSNIKNEPFYNYHGFYSVADLYLGTDNPQWQKGPIKVQVMVRYPHKTDFIV